ncbi:MAG: hypothetical protein NC548_25760 [Lachnospiraceae bacterium]|nr:hypothetical protein [Lachnospiraceae bacterium]
MADNSDKVYSGDSMSSSLNNIMGSAIGEYLTGIESNLLFSLDRDIINSINKAHPNAKLKKGKAFMAGSKKSEQDSNTAKSDVVF